MDYNAHSILVIVFQTNVDNQQQQQVGVSNGEMYTVNEQETEPCDMTAALQV